MTAGSHVPWVRRTVELGDVWSVVRVGQEGPVRRVGQTARPSVGAGKKPQARASQTVPGCMFHSVHGDIGRRDLVPRCGAGRI